MALTQNEKELLAVVKYFNDQYKRGKVAKLVAKLDKEFGRDVATQLTGFESVDVDGFNLVVKPRKKPVKKTEAETESASDKHPPVELDSDSPLHERVAYEMSMQIGAKFHQGDQFYTTKTAMETFECGQETARGAMRILKDKGLIEYADGNFRNGYVVA